MCTARAETRKGLSNPERVKTKFMNSLCATSPVQSIPRAGVEGNGKYGSKQLESRVSYM
jgi:hypothetical protein